MDLILHHYWDSNYSEKVRLMLGLKSLRWGSVVVPDVMPKPNLVALTGGYSKIPVLQIGADIYCDTLRIADVLEERFPQPSLHPDKRDAVAAVIASWSEAMTLAGARFVMGRAPERWRPEFHADRAALWGVPVDMERMVRSADRYREQLVVYLGWLASMLGDGRPFLRGDAAGLSDISCYHILWFLEKGGEQATEVLERFPQIKRWMQRVAALCHGEHTVISADTALQIARDAAFQSVPGVEPGMQHDLKEGDLVSVQAEVAGRSPTIGELHLMTARHVAVRTRTERAGEVVVHFPREGYRVARAAA